MEPHHVDPPPASARRQKGLITPRTPAALVSISDAARQSQPGDTWLAVSRTQLQQPVPVELAPVVRCATCRGVGWLRRDVPVGHPLFGKTVPCQQCDTQQRIAFAAAQKYTREPIDLRDMAANWTTFPPEMDPEAIAVMLRYSWCMCAGETNTVQGSRLKGIILMGLNQVGKSGLAYCVHRDVLAAGIPSVFIGEVELLDLLNSAMFDRDHPDRHLDMIDRLTTVSHLVLDDLGSAKLSEKREELLFLLLDQRGKQAKTVTTITTNLDAPDLKAYLGKRVYGRIAGQTFSRLVVGGVYCALIGGDPT